MEERRNKKREEYYSFLTSVWMGQTSKKAAQVLTKKDPMPVSKGEPVWQRLETDEF